MKICVLGCGNMGGAIIDGLHKSYGEKVKFEIWDTFAASAEKFTFAKIKAPDLWFENGKPDVVLVAVKPQIIKEALSVFETAGKNNGCLWISIAAGISISTLQNLLPSDAKIARVMPNTPALIGEGCSLYSLNSFCDENDKKTVEQILNSVGISFEIPESQMNAATGLSGSGPAYIYTIIEAFAEAGVAAGLPYEIALKSATQTVLGSAKMVQQAGESPATLKARVMSPNGTTVAGNTALENGGIRDVIKSAVIAATNRAEELGRNS